MAEGFRFTYLAFPFSLAENLSLSAWVSLVQHERRCSRSHGKDVAFRNVKIKIPDRKCDRGMWMTSCTGSVHGGFGGFEKSQKVEFCSPKMKVDFRSLRVPHVVWGRWKSQHRKIVYLPPYVEKPLNSKVIKSFLPELRSRKCFRVSGFLCYLYMSYEHFMYVSHIHIHVWLCNIYIYIYILDTLFVSELIGGNIIFKWEAKLIWLHKLNGFKYCYLLLALS